MTHSFWKEALKAAVALTTVISLASCKEETPNDPFANKPEKTNPTTLADVNKAEEGTSFTDLQCLTVVAANAQGLILQEFQSTKPTDCIYAYIGETHNFKVGDMVSVSGTITIRNGLRQFAKGVEIIKTWEYNYTQPKPAEFKGSDVDAYMSAPEIKYVKLDGTLRVAGNYANLEIDGTDNIGSLDYMTDDFKSKYDGHSLTISGWLFGSYKTYMYIIPVEVVDNGEYQEPVPEGAIFYSTFDKKIAVQDAEKYGTTKGWPWLDQFDGWQNQKGSGVENVTYSYQEMSVRTNQASKGFLATYDGSGNNNLFFGGSAEKPNYFIIEKIAVPSENLRLTFGAQYYSQGAANTFIKSNFEVFLSEDGNAWAPALDYDFGGVEDDRTGKWRLATADFTLPAGTRTLYIKFTAKGFSTNRLDDVLLTEGKGGQLVEFGKVVETPISTIADVISKPVDELYKIKGQVIATHTKGFLVKDNTGIILVFKKNHKNKIGDNVTVKGPTTEFGGMKQFDGSSEIVVLGNSAVSQPKPQEMKAADFEAYVQNPTIKYVTYKGTLKSVQDEIHQMHYNVEIAGTDKVQAAVSYPNTEFNIYKYDKAEIIVTGYLVGATGSEISYANTMATILKPAVEEVEPDENTALTVEALNARLDGMTSGTVLKDLVGFKGYVAANNEHGNLKGALSIVDNTGKVHSGIIVKDGSDKIAVGTKVIIGLNTAKLTISNGLRTIKGATIYVKSEKVDIKVPEINDDQLNDYMGQYVKVKNVTSPEDATLWYDADKKGNTIFKGVKGTDITVYLTKTADFGKLSIKKNFSGDIKGVIEIYGEKLEVVPTCKEDVASFTE